jgi:hypothetical protein
MAGEKAVGNGQEEAREEQARFRENLAVAA